MSIWVVDSWDGLLHCGDYLEKLGLTVWAVISVQLHWNWYWAWYMQGRLDYSEPMPNPLGYIKVTAGLGVSREENRTRACTCSPRPSMVMVSRSSQHHGWGKGGTDMQQYTLAGQTTVLLWRVEGCAEQGEVCGACRLWLATLAPSTHQL